MRVRFMQLGPPAIDVAYGVRYADVPHVGDVIDTGMDGVDDQFPEGSYVVKRRRWQWGELGCSEVIVELEDES